MLSLNTISINYIRNLLHVKNVVVVVVVVVVVMIVLQVTIYTQE